MEIDPNPSVAEGSQEIRRKGDGRVGSRNGLVPAQIADERRRHLEEQEQTKRASKLRSRFPAKDSSEQIRGPQATTDCDNAAHYKEGWVSTEVNYPIRDRLAESCLPPAKYSQPPDVAPSRYATDSLRRRRKRIVQSDAPARSWPTKRPRPRDTAKSHSLAPCSRLSVNWPS